MKNNLLSIGAVVVHQRGTHAADDPDDADDVNDADDPDDTDDVNDADDAEVFNGFRISFSRSI